MSRIFDHKKQYTCTEVFRLESLQTLARELEDMDEDFITSGRRSRSELIETVAEAGKTINEFLKNLEEQEKRS